jgi:hypothetical protein
MHCDILLSRSVFWKVYVEQVSPKYPVVILCFTGAISRDDDDHFDGCDYVSELRPPTGL